MLVDVYRTENGDTWDLIAYKIYGNELFMHDLMRANVNLIDIAVFDANIPIIVPLKSPTIDTNADANLPPWKR
ncbi:hypothetical protein IX317_002127 [Fusobacterium sp. DD29]|uniref:tail protein X n=1 Tax=unclassified Fusobacterium TaxID=2648384 RepID=UPI001B8C0489|nr:hypothetical protein [Fusobacterium sp. DD45]MBR8711954.1 hypothetical protein [Fusobacterium sp. DD28]MBR8750405.1 hypothetical protein [Fusobacterium sp. DD29]MBR8752527.1 hypothetical protein [Fusobacterium sp. DD26]MBR8762640.1 hypothetical protein [Fusobacterium sp. DD25]MBR8768676.1 hypothetical protein [Fusobacterium sp. DD43]MBR8772749.1 hypothetical protein [Fusobacterium sp. DD40]MBR8776958.1 hypothetical protein [Fusobacterium sp. DD17]MBR8799215.1 hypothetical protein [Fusoba